MADQVQVNPRAAQTRRAAMSLIEAATGTPISPLARMRASTSVVIGQVETMTSGAVSSIGARNRGRSRRYRIWWPTQRVGGREANSHKPAFQVSFSGRTAEPSAVTDGAAAPPPRRRVDRPGG